MKIANNSIVTIDYTLKDDEGNLLDSSSENGTLQYIQGLGKLSPKLEEALEGKSEGESINVILEPKDGFGEYDETLVTEVPKDNFDSTEDIKVGMQFWAEDDNGESYPVTICKITDTTITVDANHELAGKRLHYAIKVLDVREASEEDIAQYEEDCSSCSGNCSGCGGGCSSCN